MNWTTEQKRAIEEEGNLLVAAAAGSGKTAVLTERVARLVQEGASIQEFLVLTFTRAAAAEMKKRIGARLLEIAEATAEGETAARLREAATAAQSASISTIDAFCSQILRRHFHEAGLDPAFRPADEAESQILLEDAADAVIDARCELGEPVFRALARMLGGEERLRGMLIALYTQMQSRPDPTAWLRNVSARYETPNIGEADYVRWYLPLAQAEMQSALAAYRAARDDAAREFPEVAAFADGEIMRLSGTLLQKSFSAYGAALAAMAFERLKGFPRGTPESSKQAFISARNACKKCKAEQEKRFCMDLAAEGARMQALAPHMRELCACLEETAADYEALKREKGLVDYADMEHMALSLLSDARIAEEYRQRFHYIFVDEYQDSNHLQEEILNRIRRTGNLFLVGDVKQSIYRFRRAEPGLFLGKYADWQGETGRCIDLNANFRSTPAVIGMVNGLFSRIMHKDRGEIEYDERAALRYARTDGAPGTVEFHLIARDNGSYADGEEGSYADGGRGESGCIVYAPTGFGDTPDGPKPKMSGWTAEELEAQLAASRIREIMEHESYVDPKTGESKAYCYADFAVLHRSPKKVAERIVQILSMAGIPAYAELTGGYFDAIEVQIFLNLLRVIDNRRQDIPLMSVLRSPIGGWTMEELAQLRLDFPGENCLDSLLGAAAADTALGKKAADFLRKLEVYYEESMLLPVPEFIGYLLDDTGFSDYVRALPGAREGNLEALIERARAYGQSGVRSLSDFLRFMDRAKNTDALGAAQVAGADVVRLLSIHKSKGLEFPVVLLLGLDKEFNLRDLSEDILTDDALGLGLRYTEGRRRRDTLLRQVIAEKKRRAAIAEEMRILYVGMTRARERLLLFCATKDTAARIASVATAGGLMQARRASDWLLSVFLADSVGNPLREHAGLPSLGGEASMPTSVRVHTEPYENGQNGVEKADYAAFTARALLADCGGYANRFAWRYPHLADTLVPGKISVSELIGNHRSLMRYPDFIEREVLLSATDRGTAAHLCMQLIPIAPHTPESVREALSQLVEGGVMASEQAAVVDAAAISDFFTSPLGLRICASSRVERELMFNHRVSARKLMGMDTDEPVLLQGVIDCCFLADGKWVLVDYKTDAVPLGQDPARIAQRHRAQLAFYAEALEALTGIPVGERYIHLLRSGDSVRLD